MKPPPRPSDSAAQQPTSDANAIEPIDAAASQKNSLSDKARSGAATSKHLQASFGQVVGLLMHTQTHGELTLKHLQTAVLPAIVTGQFLVAQHRSDETGLAIPIAAMLWANVSEEVDQRLSSDPAQLTQLAAPDWQNGKIAWVVIAVGDDKLLKDMLDRLRETDFKDRTIKLYATNADGKTQLVVLKPE